MNDTLRRLSLAEASRLIPVAAFAFARDPARWKLAVPIQSDPTLPENVVELRRGGKVVGRLIGCAR